MARPPHPQRFAFKGRWKKAPYDTPVEVLFRRPGKIEGDRGFRNVFSDCQGSLIRYEGTPVLIDHSDPLAVWIVALRFLKITETEGAVPTMTRDERFRHLSRGWELHKNKMVMK